MTNSTYTHGRIIGGAREVEWRNPRSPNGEAVLLVRGWGANALYWANQRLPYELVTRGYACAAQDLGGTATWGNNTFLTAMDSVMTYMDARWDKVHVVAVSMGATDVLNWTRRNPGRVGGVALIAPVVQLDAFHDRDGGGLATSIETAYGGAAGYEAALPQRDPMRFAKQIYSGDTIGVWYSSDDTTVVSSEPIGFANDARAMLYGQGAVGHTIDGVRAGDVAALFAAA